MSELGAATRGTCSSFDALKGAASKFESDLFDVFPIEEIKNCNDLFQRTEENPFAKRLGGMITMYNRICDAISKSAHFPLIISGDHSAAGGTIAALRKANPNKKIGIIWIDAHADLHTPYTSHTGNIHGMPVACMLGIDNMENQFKEIDQETIDGWNELKSIGGNGQNIGFGDIVQYSVRDTEPEEDYLIEHKGIKAFSVDEIRTEGTVACAKAGLDYLKDHDLIYVSFDVDSMDPEISVGTGTPVKGGLTVIEAEEIIITVLGDDRVGCFEMTEINPVIDDKGNTMAETAFKILEKVVSKLES